MEEKGREGFYYCVSKWDVIRVKRGMVLYSFCKVSNGGVADQVRVCAGSVVWSPTFDEPLVPLILPQGTASHFISNSSALGTQEKVRKAGVLAYKKLGDKKISMPRGPCARYCFLTSPCTPCCCIEQRTWEEISVCHLQNFLTLQC